MKLKPTLFSILFLLINGSYSFAQTTIGIQLNSASSFDGYTLLAPLAATQTFLVNNCGELINEWNASTYTPAASVYLLDDGSILRTCKLSGGIVVTGGSGGRIEKYNWNDSLTWSYNFDGPRERQHHDIELLPNGNILVLSWDLRTRQEAIAAGLDTNHFSGNLLSEKVTEIRPLGSDSAEIVWEWFLWDHLVQDFNSSAQNFGIIDTNRQLVNLNYSGNNGIGLDYFHANSLAYNPSLDQIIISIRNYDEIWVIDHGTTTMEASGHTGGTRGMGGDLLYRYGNPEAYGVGSINDKQLFGQHDAHWIPAGLRDSGKIIVFNNGFNKPALVSQVEIIQPPINAAGTYNYLNRQPYGPRTPSWTYQVPLFVDFISGANRLPNGNTLICSGPNGHLIELDSADNIVWEYINPIEGAGVRLSQGSIPSNNPLFRAYRYSPNHPAFANRTLTPNGYLELNSTPNCVLYNNSSNIGELTEELKVKVIQNPFRDFLSIANKNNETLSIKVFNLMGTLMFDSQSSAAKIEIETSNWSNQIYIVLIQSGHKMYQRKVLKI